MLLNTLIPGTPFCANVHHKKKKELASAGWQMNRIQSSKVADIIATVLIYSSIFHAIISAI